VLQDYLDSSFMYHS